MFWNRKLKKRLQDAEDAILGAYAPLQPGPPKGLGCEAEGGPCQWCQCEWEIAVSELKTYIKKYIPYEANIS